MESRRMEQIHPASLYGLIFAGGYVILSLRKYYTISAQFAVVLAAPRCNRMVFGMRTEKTPGSWA